MARYSVGKFAKLAGVSVSTLQKWDREGKLVPLRTMTNRRIYTDEHLAQVYSRKGEPSDGGSS